MKLPLLATLCGLVFLAPRHVCAQELEPRAYSPSPIGTTFVITGIGRSQGAILLDPSLDVDNVQGDLWIATLGAGRVFNLAGRQARILAVFPLAWGAITGDVGPQPERQDLAGLVDPRFKLSIALRGGPALSPAEFARAPRRVVVGASVTIVPPIGQYNSAQLVNLGYNRWAFKPEVGVSHQVGQWTFDVYGGVWIFTTNDAYFPGDAHRRQDPVVALQTHVSYALPRRTWLRSTERGSRADKRASNVSRAGTSSATVASGSRFPCPRRPSSRSSSSTVPALLLAEVTTSTRST
jgi:Putative MetA-pathway of phenol degradation